MEREGWKVTPKVKLPLGYELHEDSTGVYLYTNDELVATFSHYASPYMIRTEALKHLNTGGAAGEEVGQERTLGVG